MRKKKRKIVEFPSEGQIFALAVTPVPERRPDHVQAIAEMSLRMVEDVERANRDLGTPFKARIGIHSGKTPWSPASSAPTASSTTSGAIP